MFKNYSNQNCRTDKNAVILYTLLTKKNEIELMIIQYSLCVNPLAQSLGQVKLDSDKWKLWKNLFEKIENFSKFGFRANRWIKLRQRLSIQVIKLYFFYNEHCNCSYIYIFAAGSGNLSSLLDLNEPSTPNKQAPAPDTAPSTEILDEELLALGTTYSFYRLVILRYNIMIYMLTGSVGVMIVW